ncbi:MAG: ribonuclease domain-containing protein, partial [Eubacteriales bacterium]|nr:ribonuclease domain-containing protein [Eubacteriales bacterium]
NNAASSSSKSQSKENASEADTNSEAITVERDGTYDSKDEVALYIHTYGELPSNYITKKEARSLGWEGGSVEEYAEGKCIGGDYFGNYEGILPDEDGIRYTECDINTRSKGSRGGERIIFDNQGNIYYTDDHYRSFTKLYDKDGKL